MGGSDSGAVGYIVEKEANLAMALACRDYLTAHGVEVRMSRTKDEEDPINEEVRECNAYNPDLAIDVHNNSGGGDGFEVYHTLNGGTGKVLAQNIEKQVIKIGQNSRGCKTRQGQRGDYYAFVRDTKCPAVICEGVFVDTKSDAAQAGTRQSSRRSASHTPRVSSIRWALSMTLRPTSLLSRPSRRTRKYRLQSKKSRPRPAWRKRPSSICSHTNTANSS